MNVHQPSAEQQNDYVEKLTADLFWEKKITGELKDGKNVLVIVYINIA